MHQNFFHFLPINILILLIFFTKIGFSESQNNNSSIKNKINIKSHYVFLSTRERTKHLLNNSHGIALSFNTTTFKQWESGYSLIYSSLSPSTITKYTPSIKGLHLIRLALHNKINITIRKNLFFQPGFELCYITNWQTHSESILEKHSYFKQELGIGLFFEIAFSFNNNYNISLQSTIWRGVKTADLSFYGLHLGIGTDV